MDELSRKTQELRERFYKLNVKLTAKPDNRTARKLLNLQRRQRK